MSVPFQVRKVNRPDGLVSFCRAEQLNPSRIPAVIVEEDGKPLRENTHTLKDMFGDQALFNIVGVQTNYETGNSTIHKETIEHLVEYTDR